MTSPLVTIILLVVGIISIIWYCIAMGYTFVNIGNSDDFSSYANQLGTILGVSMVGCIALAIGVTLLSFQWTSIETTAIMTILISILALGLSVSALAVAAITH
jgi:hypothetical protein